jgi:3-isopropylmalate/(R)-2-methylmalate dehydratase small subunit
MGKVIYKLEDDISTDVIYPGRYMATVLPTETPQFAFDDISELNNLLNDESPQDERIIVAGDNFGCGSSREQAVSTLKGHEVIIVARHFARIFLQNSINLGLKTVICPDIEADIGDELEINDEKLINITKNKKFEIKDLPESKKAVVEAGGLIPYTRQRLTD